MGRQGADYGKRRLTVIASVSGRAEYSLPDKLSRFPPGVIEHAKRPRRSLDGACEGITKERGVRFR